MARAILQRDKVEVEEAGYYAGRYGEEYIQVVDKYGNFLGRIYGHEVGYRASRCTFELTNETIDKVVPDIPSALAHLRE